VPESVPVLLLNVAHDGLSAIANQSVRPYGSEVPGVNE
jgi:hypothetical protein